MEGQLGNQINEAERFTNIVSEDDKTLRDCNQLLEEEIKEEYEEKMVLGTKGRLKPGEFRESELLDHDESLLTVRDHLNEEYGKIFWIRADQTNESLQIESVVSSEALGRIDDVIVGNMLEKLDKEIRSSNCRRFKSLTFALHFCHVLTGTGFEKFFSSGEINLEKLSFSLAESNNVTNDGLIILAKQIRSSLQSLKHLHITFPPQTSDAGLKEFAIQSFPSLKNLQHLGFNIYSQQISDTGVKDLAILISKDLKDLQSLSLNLSWCTEITDNGLRELIIPLVSDLRKLQHLNLDFSTSEKITGAGFRDMIFPDVNNILHINLNFSECTKFNDDGLKGLGTQFLSRFKGLQHLELKFTGCKQVKDNGLVDLTNQISLNLPDLEHLDLIFDGCKMITNQGVQQMADQIRPRLQKLQKLDLLFYNCAKNVKKLKKNLEEKFKTIPKLKIELG